MAVILTSNTATPEELSQALAAKGYTPSEAPKTEEKAEASATGEAPVEGKEHSETDPPKADEKKPEGETKTESLESGKEDTNRESATDGKPEDGGKKSKGGFQAKLEKQTKEIARLEEKLSEERGDRRRLEAQLEEARAKLAELQEPKQEEKREENKEVDLVRPEMPVLSDPEFDFDQEKYDAAMKEYPAKLEAYFNQQNERRLRQEAKERNEAEQKKAKETAAEAAAREFHTRVQDGAKDIPDYEEVLASVPADAPSLLDNSQAAETYIAQVSQNPAALLHYLMKDLADGDGAENQRIAKLAPMQQVIELSRIEERLAAAKGKSPAAAEPPKKEEPKARTEAKEESKPKKAPEAPIDTVGGRQHSAEIDFKTELQKAAEANDPKRYRELRAMQRVAAAKAQERVA